MLPLLIAFAGGYIYATRRKPAPQKIVFVRQVPAPAAPARIGQDPTPGKMQSQAQVAPAPPPNSPANLPKKSWVGPAVMIGAGVVAAALVYGALHAKPDPDKGKEDDDPDRTDDRVALQQLSQPSSEWMREKVLEQERRKAALAPRDLAPRIDPQARIGSAEGVKAVRRLRELEDSGMSVEDALQQMKAETPAPMLAKKPGALGMQGTLQQLTQLQDQGHSTRDALRMIYRQQHGIGAR